MILPPFCVLCLCGDSAPFVWFVSKKRPNSILRQNKLISKGLTLLLQTQPNALNAQLLWIKKTFILHKRKYIGGDKWKINLSRKRKILIQF